MSADDDDDDIECKKYNLNCISCTLCDRSFHRSHFGHINQVSSWFCEECISDLFPFNHLSDDNEFNDCVRDLDPLISKIDLLTDGPCLNLFGDVSSIRPLLVPFVPFVPFDPFSHSFSFAVSVSLSVDLVSLQALYRWISYPPYPVSLFIPPLGHQ